MSIDVEIDPHWDEPDFDDYDTRVDEITCKRCGAEGLIWLPVQNKFRLHEADCTPHVCVAFNQTIDDFQEIK